LSVSRIWLQQRGVGSAGQELTGGFWRVDATTGSAETQFLTFNTTTAEQKANPGDYPSDVAIKGSIIFGVFQSQNSYWKLPLVKVKDITVYPTMHGMMTNFQYLDWAYKNPLIVSVWRTDLSQKELVIPFSAGVLKTAGENPGSFATDYPGAVPQTTSQGTGYSFDISFKQIATGELSKVINWYNPSKPTETVKMTLQFTVGGSEYDWNKDLVFITNQNGGPISNNNVFNSYDLSNIDQLLNYQLGNDWSYYHYFFGGGDKFRGYAYDFAGLPVTSDTKAGVMGLFETWDGVTVKPSITNREDSPGPTYSGALCEGYKSDTSAALDWSYQYPGWYVPATGNGEGPSQSGEWWKYRFPLAGTVYNDQETLKPKGLSIVNYLTTAVKAPYRWDGSNNPTKPINLIRENPNYYGAGYSGDCPSGYQVQIPRAARQWYFTLDVSTEAADTVVVSQNYIDAKITNWSVDRATVGAGQTALVNVVIKNTSPFAGAIAQGVNIPPDVASSIAVTGGDGALYFQAGEEKTVTLQIKNTGNLVSDKTVSFTYSLQNDEPRVTDSRTFSLTFQAGLGNPDTTITVTTLSADSNEPIGGLLVKAFYGDTMDLYKSSSTLDGATTLEMGQYRGNVKIEVSDPASRFSTQEKTIVAKAGPNYVVFLMTEGEAKPPIDWWMIIAIVAVVAGVVAVAAVAAKARKKTKTP